MTNKTLQSFLKEVFQLTVEKCTQEFSDQFLYIKRERERILNNSWKEIPKSEKMPGMKKIIFKEIDFDTIITHSKHFISDIKVYLQLINKLAKVSIKYAQFTKATNLLIEITKNKDADNILVAKSFRTLSNICFNNGDSDSSIKYLNKSTLLFKKENDSFGILQNKIAFGVIQVNNGQPSEGKLIFLEAQQMSSQHDNHFLKVQIFSNLGNVCSQLGDLDESMGYYQNALDILKSKDNPRQRARLLHNIAINYKIKQDYGKASAYLTKCIKLAKENNDVYQKGLSYLEQSEVKARMGELSESNALVMTTFQIFSELQAKSEIAEVYKILGLINRKGKNFNVAMSYYENSKRINKEDNNHLNLGETYLEIGKFYEDTGNRDLSVENYQSALKEFQFIEANARVTQTEQALSNLTI
mgnify:FL=1